MATLHIVRQSAFVSNDFVQCISSLCRKDTVALIDDGCYNMKHSLIKSIDSKMDIQLHVLAKHAQARALAINETEFSKMNMKNLVELTFSHDRVITWQ